jgi:hypothetical protein
MVGSYKFVGIDSWYFSRHTYVLSIRRTLFGRIVVAQVHGYEDMPFLESRRKYRNWKAFRRDWIKV